MADVRRVFDDLVRLEIAWWNAADARLKADCGLPLALFEAMAVIDRQEGCRVYDVASAIGIGTGSASKLVDRVEALGHCRRLPNPRDRRSSLLELTADGARLFGAAAAALDDELERRLGSAVPAADLEQFAATLRRLRAAGDAAPAEPVAEAAGDAPGAATGRATGKAAAGRAAEPAAQALTDDRSG